MTYVFYLKQFMPAFEWKLNAMINKDKNLINKFPQNWRHILLIHDLTVIGIILFKWNL